jgi:UDP-2-acetamido-3-amino-2,3-dideoxy-glucuronate N-acetyltransferase
MPSDPSVVVHEKGLCEGDVGPRTRVWAFAHVMKGARVGADCNICMGAFVEAGAVIGNRVTVKNGVQVWDGVTIEDDVFLGPNATLTNVRNPRAAFKAPPEAFAPTRICRGATIGANATIVCGNVIGAQAFVAAGAVVTRSVPAHALMLGNPARQAGWMCACGERLAETLACTCGRRFRLVDSDAGLAPLDTA